MLTSSMWMSPPCDGQTSQGRNRFSTIFGTSRCRREGASTPSLKVLCELVGWKTAKTVLQCYQRADEDRLRKALASRRNGALDPV